MRHWRSTALVLVAVSLWASACDGQSMKVRLVNDTNSNVDFLQCKGKGWFGTGTDCDNVGGRSAYDKAPGEWYTALVSVGADTWYRVVDESGVTIGCLRMEFDRVEEGVEVLASSAQHDCPA
jgi:hypothetical protein